MAQEGSRCKFTAQAGAEDPVTLREEMPRASLMTSRQVLSSSGLFSTQERSPIYINSIQKRTILKFQCWL